MAADRQHAHELLDQLGPSQLAAVVHLLEAMLTPQDEPDILSNAERKAVAEADEWLAHNEPVPHEDVLADFGLSMADWNQMGQDSRSDKPPGRNG